MIKDARRALALLTVAPDTRDPVDRSGATGWFPWVGLALGAVTVLPLAVVSALNADGGQGEIIARAAVLFAMLVVGIQGLLSRLVHFESFARLMHAVFKGKTPRERLALLDTESITYVGAAAVALATFLYIAATTVVLGSGNEIWLLIAVPVLGRLSATFGAWFGSSATPDGLHAGMIGQPKALTIVIAALALALVAAGMFHFYDRTGLIWLAVAAFVALSIPHQLAEKFKGVTGDVMWASVLITEVIALVFAAIWLAW